MTKTQVFKQIRKFCCMCMGGSTVDGIGYGGDNVFKNIANCTASPETKEPYDPCPLWDLRFGIDPDPAPQSKIDAAKRMRDAAKIDSIPSGEAIAEAGIEVS